MTWAYLAHLSLHFIVPPMIFLAPDLLPTHLIDSGLHRPLIATMLCASTIILTLGWHRHRQATVLWWGGVGGFCLCAAVWGLEGIWDKHDAALAIGTAGSIFLAVGHWRNHQFWCRLDRQAPA